MNDSSYPYVYKFKQIIKNPMDKAPKKQKSNNEYSHPLIRTI